MLRSVGYQIGEGSKIVGPLFNTGTLIVGRNSWIGRNITIHGNGSVVIGDGCDVAPDVVFATGGHQIGRHDRRAGTGEKYHIEVGDGTWIGVRTTVLGNTTIGKGCVVAAGACVLNDVEDDVLIGGVPAKCIRKLEQ